MRASGNTIARWSFAWGRCRRPSGRFCSAMTPTQNPLIGVPPAYGYYYKPVTFLGLVGAQVDATAGKFDARAQFVNSSPANRRSIFDNDQYGNWAGGRGLHHSPGISRRRVGLLRSVSGSPISLLLSGRGESHSLAGERVRAGRRMGLGPLERLGRVAAFQDGLPRDSQFHAAHGIRRGAAELTPRWYAAARIGY